MKIGRRNCSVCKSEADFKFVKNGFNILQCRFCGHRYIEEQPGEQHSLAVYDDTYFKEGGAGYEGYLLESQLLYRQGGRYSKILKGFMKPGNVLDVGAAAGFILKGFTDTGWSGLGLEPNKAMVDYGTSELHQRMVLSNMENYSTEERFDAVLMIQVIAHFFDLERAFYNVRSLINPGGYLLIETWNRKSLSARLFGKRWHEYSPPSVLQWFTKKSLRLLMEYNGFDLVKEQCVTKIISGRHAKTLLQYKLDEWPMKSCLLKLLMLIPSNWKIFYPGNDLFYSIYRKR